MEISVSAEEVLLRIGGALSGDGAGPGGIHILLACAPKSGSTFLSSAIANLPDFTKADLTLGYGRREQELCIFHCAATHSANYVAQHHTRYSDTTGGLIRAFRLFPVVLTRNLFDTVVSLRDHLLTRPMVALAYVDEAFVSWEEERQLDFVIDFCLPWYANFAACWAQYDGPGMRVRYQDLVERPAETVRLIAAAAGAAFPREVAEQAVASVRREDMRFNVGRAGRGREVLSRAQIARIHSLLEPYGRMSAVQELLTVG